MVELISQNKYKSLIYTHLNELAICVMESSSISVNFFSPYGISIWFIHVHHTARYADNG